MPIVVDSYSESNYSGVSFIVESTQPGAGQAFTGDGGTLNNAQFYCQKFGSPTGSVFAKIYAETHSTAYGTDSVPTGSALATSDAVDISTIGSGSLALVTFTFSGANKITLSNGTHYIVTVEYTGGDLSNYLLVGADNTSPTHAGNSVENTNSHPGWFSISSEDTCFYVYKDDPVTTTSTTTTSTSTTTTSTSTTTLPPESYGIYVKKAEIQLPKNTPRNFFMNSNYSLLKIHKQGAFTLTVPKGDAGGSATLGFPELPYRPLALVYMQRYNSDGTLDSNYHLLEWAYWGASKVGWQKVEIYPDKLVIGYRDQTVEELLAISFSVKGYYYIFEERVDG